ncbi:MULTISPECIES: IclR family transcriptional regulator [Brevibacillus]|jgi:DNA-binding IclR family transcriptional regulator|uniref:IclR family transcriptional regulator n=1 Tax=Brevibacillus TaxID=55080 RepID=UPI00156B87A5|nr:MULTISPECIES: IclR family transcriptional regulator [Brevibacillus]MBU8712693.1 helix-turn-helix domain-containing protein [Brevibacillus parabrevis]MDH6348194.1 DNA-binding IclR family transcriptional regulator [Brevibacillus sp. 1238]MDR5000318.1 IclR family transcriptional regulator [Brevibacillus parabrevis]MED2256696.1 IclR family transcriptional regulator [Brevibacillus parabrevis]NRQ52718.1 IclR family transcriptional regulator [Brevibacillus sp. HD1.4A]
MSAEKTLDILDLFDFDTRALNVPQIAEKLGQPQSSVYRHLRLLKEKGYIMESANGYYSLGYRFLKLAKIVRLDMNITAIAQPVMRQLTKETEETSILLVYSNMQAVCLETIASHQPIKVSSEQGQIVPLYGGASSKALLAFLAEEIVEELYGKGFVRKHTEQTITDLAVMKQNLAEIREKGYAFSDGEIDEGVVSYGVPIHDSDQQVVASLSIAGPRGRMLEKDEKELVAHLMAAAESIQRYL